MSEAHPSMSPFPSVPLTDDEANFILATARRFFGGTLVVRNYGTASDRIDLHFEADENVGMEQYDCLGVLMTRIDRPISLAFTRRGTRVRGNAKLAYRHGQIL